MKRSALISIGLALLATDPATAAIGPRNSKGWRGMDTLAPAPSLPTAGPASYLNLLVGTTASGVVTATPGDDQVISNSDMCPYGNTNPYGNGAQCSLQIHTNGIVTRRQGTPFFDNGPLVDPRFNMMMAPFWDDLAPVAGVSTITWEVEAASHFIVRWNDFALYSNPSASLTFQVAMSIDGAFGAPRWILFQYIKMLGVGANGASATIGVQYRYNRSDAAHGVAANAYAANVPGSIVTGDATAMPGTALQAILFDIDSDADHLPRHLETRLGTNDTLADTDGGGVDDAPEFVAATDPLSPLDDVATDTDGDGLTNADEVYYGTNPGVDDTDGDGLDDPTELAAGSDPTDGGSFPTALLTTGGTNKVFPQAAVDAAGNVHAVAFESNLSSSTLYYYMFDSVGRPLIAETAFKGTPSPRRAQVHAHAGKIYVTYEIANSTTNSASLRLLRINPAADDRDGDAAVPATVTEIDVALPLGDRPRHHDAWVDANGVHLVWEDHPDERPSGTGEDGPASIRYGRVSLGGAFQAEANLMDITQGRGNRPPYGIHRKSLSPRLAVDSSGVAHIVWSAQSRPRSPQSDDYALFPNGMYYAATDGTTTTGPFAIGPGRIERLDVALHQDRYLYFTSSAGGSDGDGYFLTKGVRLGILDTQSYAIIPRVGDIFGVEWAIHEDSLLLPITTVLAGVRTHGSAVHVLPNGAAIIYYAEDKRSEMCFVVAAPDGTAIDTRRCFFQNQHHIRDRIPALVQPMGAAFVGVVHGNRDSELRYDPVALSNWDTSGVTFPNSPPIITTQAPVGTTAIGELYSYAASATDPETAAGNLVWSLVGAPTGMNVNAAGLVTFTPGSNQAGTHTPSLQVCDDDAAPRCTDQVLTVTVPQPSAPVITSTAALFAVAGAAYEYQVTATDADDDIASFSIVTPASPPGDMAIAANAGGALLTWTPANADVGTLAITVAVTDDAGLQGTQSFTLAILPGGGGTGDGGGGSGDGGTGGDDRPPIFSSIPSTTALVGEAYTYEIIASDPDDAAATIAIELVSAAVDNMAISKAGVLSWTPSERGTVTITIEATSGGATATQSFAVTVVGAGEIDGGCGCAVGRRSDASAAGALLAALLALAAVARRRNG